MATAFHNQVGLANIKFAKVNRTFRLAAGITSADTGKAVSLDTSAANTVKLAGDGDTIIGYLETYEDRQVGAVALNFTEKLPIATSATVAVGDTVVGAGNGEVKAAAAPNHSINYVTEVANGFATVVKA